MGEFSDYFEDFPEENPANYDANGLYNPKHREENERLRNAMEKLDPRNLSSGSTNIPKPPN
jgi:hypothetical protein